LEKTGKKIKVSSAKGKGRNLQKWVCERISELTGIPYDQSDDYCLIHSREMGQSGLDVILRGEAKEKFPFSCECKATETFSLVAAIKQVKEAQLPDTDWLVIHRQKAVPETVVVCSWNTFEGLLRKKDVIC